MFQGRYEIVRCLGQGGMGVVYEVMHRATDRRRALKVMLPGLASSPEAKKRFEREAKVTAGIDSEFIAEVFDAGVDGPTGSPFFVMELLRGRDLSEVLEERGCLSARETHRLVRQAALGLDRAHKRGIVHRDLKPENIFVCESEDGPPKVKLLDFGIAKVLNGASGAGLTRGLVGTPNYVAPEQVTGACKIGPAADIYALGLLTYRCLVGESYFAREIEAAETLVQVIAQVIRGTREDASVRARERANKELSPAFDEWFHKITHEIADERFATAGEAARALSEALGLPQPSLVDLEEAGPIASLATPAVRDEPRAEPAGHFAAPTRLSASSEGPGSTVLALPPIIVDAGATVVASVSAARPRVGKTTRPLVRVLAIGALVALAAFAIAIVRSRTAANPSGSDATTRAAAPPPTLESAADGAQADGAQADGAQADGAQADGAQADTPREDASPDVRPMPSTDPSVSAPSTPPTSSASGPTARPASRPPGPAARPLGSASASPAASASAAARAKFEPPTIDR